MVMIVGITLLPLAAPGAPLCDARVQISIAAQPNYYCHIHLLQIHHLRFNFHPALALAARRAESVCGTLRKTNNSNRRRLGIKILEAGAAINW